MEPKSLRLADLKLGESAIIQRLESAPQITVHLAELGLVPGERVKLFRTAPWGDPLEIELMNYRLAIRRSEAQDIIVTPESTA